MNTADEIAKLAQLRDQGVLTEDEFQAQKAAVLRGEQPGAQAAAAAKKGGVGKGCLIVVAVILVLIVIGAIVGAGNQGSDVVAPGDTVDASGTVKSGPSLTMDGYNRIRNGMTYDEVVAIVGKPSQEMARNEIAGTETVAYMWEGSLGANMNAMFQNGKLVQKAQFGLR